ncbi:MAG: N-acetylmuramic acid 6-phosphate etherase [Phycisphaerae bacterium]|nr:N-acetylmuramic acid 6-phosphate etherase [Tepidisphaeraceae bacterium]
MDDRSNLLTERRLAESMGLDAMSALDAVALMNRQDALAVEAVGKVGPEIARAVELVVEALGRGGRLIYFGAGTSGRLGVLDASECPPTFRVPPEMVQGVIAGGNEAMFRAKEGAEDSVEGGAADVDAKNVGPDDVAMGIAAGGTTPYVRGALTRARERGARTVFLACVEPTPGEAEVDVQIRPLVGPEVLTGSTRLKAGTATKLVLNTITTVAMVRLGKCYENLMVDLRASNVKLWERGTRIVATLTGLDRAAARTALEAAQGHVKLAVVMVKRDVGAEAGKELLERAGGRLRRAIEG